MYLLAGSQILQRLPNHRTIKIDPELYNVSGANYIDLHTAVKNLNQPHLDRIERLLTWVMTKKTDNQNDNQDIKFVDYLQIQNKAPGVMHDDPVIQMQMEYLEAYNQYFETCFYSTDVNLPIRNNQQNKSNYTYGISR